MNHLLQRGSVPGMPGKAKIPEGYVPAPGGGVELERHEKCGQEHDITHLGMGPCPNCKRLTMRWYCAIRGCPGMVIADNHRCTQREFSR